VSFPAVVASALKRNLASTFNNRIARMAKVVTVCMAVLCLSTAAAYAKRAGVTYSSAVRTLSSFGLPLNLAVDSKGNVYVADHGKGAVLEIVAVNGRIPDNPTIRTLGNGFDAPYGVAVDASGNVYVADSGSGLVREIVAVSGSIPDNPTVKTLGSGFVTPTGVAVDASGDVFVSDEGSNAVQEIVAVNGSIPDNPTINTLGGGFEGPYSVAVDGSGNVFVGAGSGGLEELVGGSGRPQYVGDFGYVLGVAVDASGNVYVNDQRNKVVQKLLAVNGSVPASPTINTLAVTQSISLFGIAVDGSGNVFVSSQNGKTVSQIQTGTVAFNATGVGSNSTTQALTFVVGANVSIGSIVYLTQGAPNLDFKAPANDSSTTLCAVQTYSSAASCTVDVTFAPTLPGLRVGAVQILDNTTPIPNVLATVNLSGTGTGPLVTYGPPSIKALGSFAYPHGVAVDSSGNVYVADAGNNTVNEIVAVGGVIPGSPTFNVLGGSFNQPSSLAVDGSGNVYVADAGNNAVEEIVAVGGVIPANPTINTLGSGFSYPTGVAVDGSGNVYVADSENNTVKEIVAVDGVIPDSPTIRTLGSGFSYPSGVAVDGNGNVYVADNGNNAVKEIVAVSGVIPDSPTIRTLGSGFLYPGAVAVDGNGSVYVADTLNSAVKEIVAVGGVIPSSPTIRTLGGGFNYPYGVAVGDNGNVYVADAHNFEVKEIDVADVPSLSFATTNIGSTSSDSPKTVSITNNGNAGLVVSVPTSGTNPYFGGTVPASYSLSTGGTCPQLTTSSSAATLNPGVTCSGMVSFTPTATSNAATLNIVDNNLNAVGATQSFTLSGTGVIVVNHLVFTTAPSTATAGTSISVTVTGYSSTDNSTVATNYTGPVTFTSTDTNAVFPTGTLSLTAGVGTFSITLKTAGAETITVADSSSSPSATSGTITVSAGTASAVSVASGSSQTAVIGAAFANALTAKVVDAYSNPVSGVTVTFTAPTTGASATFSAATCTTATDGTCSVTATANSTASSATYVSNNLVYTYYTVSATVSGGTTAASFSLANMTAVPTVTLTVTPTTPIVYGSSKTAMVSSVTSTVGQPTGTVTLYNNYNTVLATNLALTSGTNSYNAGYLAPGSYILQTNYSSDANFNSTSSSPQTYVVSKASSTLTGPTGQPLQITVNAGGSIPVTVTGQYSGTGISAPSVSISYTIPSPCAASCTGTAAITAGAVTVPTPSTLSPGLYTVAITYAGDTNYAAATGINVQIQVGQLTPTVTYPAQTAITYGSTLASNLNATTAYSTTSLTAGGTTAYTATLGAGSPVAVTAGTVLAAGTYTLTATWTPDSSNATLYKSASNTTTLVVNKAPLTVTVNAATSAYGVALPTLTGTVTGVVSGDGITASYATTATSTSTPGGSYSITATLNDPNSKLGNYTVTNTPAALTIVKAAAGISISQTAPLPVTGGAGVGVPVTFAVVVVDATASSTGVPTSTVQFFNGGTAIGSPVTLVKGAASFTYTFTTVQTASITAQYVGDGNFNGATSAALTEAVVTPGYGVTANPTTLTLTRGTVGTAVLTFTPYGNYQGTATYSCTGLPAFSSCAFTPTTITFSGNNAVQTATLQIYTLAPQATASPVKAAVLWVPGMLLAMLGMFRRRKLAGMTRGLLLLAVMVCAAFGMTGCGSNNYSTPTGTDSVQVVVTATATPGTSSSNLSQTATISITVQ